MRGLVIRVFGPLLAIGLLTSAGQPTYAGDGTGATDTVCASTDTESGTCLVTVHVPATPGPPGDSGDEPASTGGGNGCVWDGTSQGISNPPPGPVPCSSVDGYWSNGYNCYISTASPQPPAGDPAWQGHTPGDGQIYNCSQPQTGLAITIWAADPPPDASAGPTPGDVAELAVKQMDLRAINIGIAPEPGRNSIGLVGMPVWMWAASPDDHTVGPATATASAGGITVTATARLSRITWEMGDGKTVVCKNAGTQYKAAYGKQQSPDCGYTYTTSSSTKPDQKFKVTATSDWVITWAGAGQTGTTRLNGLARSVQIAVGEAQVLVE